MATEEEVQNLSDECFDVKCTICTKKNLDKEARKYCTECKKSLCQDCVEIHIEHNEGHTLVDTHGGDDEEVKLLTEKCEKHKDRLIELFCVDHDQLVCSLCALLEHRKCDGIKHITDSIEDLNKDQKVHEVPEQLKTSLQNVDHVITALEQHANELSQCEHRLLDEIQEYTKRILAKIEVLQRNARQDVSAKHGHAATEIREKRNICATAKSDIKKCMDDMASARNRKAHLFILKKKNQALISNVETLCSESENMIEKTTFTFKPDLRIEDKLNELISLVTEREKYEVSLRVNIDASVKDDSKSSHIMGCYRLPDGTVLLTDDNNKRMKLVDTDGTIKDHCDVKGHIWGITDMGQHEVAVSTGSTSVQVVSLSDKMTCTSSIQLRNKCYRFAQSKGELFVTDLSNYVYVYDKTGTLLRTIRKDKSGEDMFSYITGIVLNQAEERVYLTDWYKGLVCMDRAGQEVFRRSGKELGLDAAHDVCTDQGGNLMICGYKSHNVVQVAADGRVIGEILSKADGIFRPKCLCYDADRRRLYVGDETSNVLVYQLV